YGVARWRGQPAPVQLQTREVVGAVVPAGLESELHAALIEPDLLKRTARISQLLEPLGPQALGPVQSAMTTVVLDSRDVELILLADWWARFDPPAALAWARDSKMGWHPAVV